MSLQYNVATLLKEPVGSTREFEVDNGVLMDADAPDLQRVVGHATLLRTRHGVLVTARLRGIQHEQCSRCLQPLDIPLQLDIEEEFFATVDVKTGAGLSPPEDPEAFPIDAHHTLDLEDAVRQYWATAWPMQPLCRPECRGLCPRCGQDWNLGPCSCPPEEDERWSALRQLVRAKEGG